MSVPLQNPFQFPRCQCSISACYQCISISWGCLPCMCQLSSLRSLLCHFLLGRPRRGWWAGCCSSPQILCQAREPRQFIAGGLWSLPSCTKGCWVLGACKNSLDGSSCFIRMAQHWLLLPSFVVPVCYLFAASIYLQWYLLLNLQCWVLGLRLLPEMWSSLKCPWVLVSVHFLSGSPGLLLLATVIQEVIPGVLCHDHFLLNWKVIQTTQKFHKNMLISYGELL